MAKPLSDVELSGRKWWRAAWWAGSAVILSAAFILTSLSDSVDWTLGDFAAAAFLLGLAGGAIEVSFRLLERPLVRGLAVAATLIALVLVWALLATP